MHSSPPKWADRFLKWYCNPNLLEEIQGDAHELYYRRVDEEGETIANRKFIWDVVRFFRWSNIKRSNSKYNHSNHLDMFRNYIKVGIRNLIRNWGISFINISGLSLAVGCAVTLFMFNDFQHNMDSFHKNGANIYQVINKIKTESEVQTWGDSPLLLGPELVSGHTAVKNAIRVEFRNGNMRYKDRVFSENIVFTDPEFMSTFDFPMAYGNMNCLRNKEEIIISHNIAEKYFGDLSAVGERISIKFSNGEIRNFNVGAVLDKFPLSASFRFHIMVPIDNFFDIKFQEHYGWDEFADGTFIELHDGHHPSELEDILEASRALQNQTQTKWPIHKFELLPLELVALKSYEVMSSVATGSHGAGRQAIMVIAILLLAMACFNYMNIAVAAGTKRLKEIALRKVMGSARQHIINQFLIENLLLCCLAIILGVALSYYLFLPGFNFLIPITIPFGFSSVSTAILFFGGLLLVTGLASGAYPAFYISKYQPVHILRGKQKFGSKSLFSKILLTIQFILAFTTIVGCFVFTDNATYLKHKDWGYTQANILTVPVSNIEQYNGLRDAATKKTGVKSFAGSVNHIAWSDPTTTVDYLDQQVQAKMYAVGWDYLETLNIRLAKGRFFEKEKTGDRNATVVSKKFVAEMGWDDPLEKAFTYDSVRYTVIGVIEDFHYSGFYSTVLPILFKIGEEDQFRFFAVQVESGNAQEMSDYLAATWKNIAPNDPFDVYYQEDALAGFYRDNEANIIILSFISGFAIVLACLGLFGLLTFNIHRRMKEFSVRKVLGARGMSIAKLANKEYVWILLIAFLLGAPFGYLLINQLIQAIYPDPKDADAMPFVLAISIMVITVAITVTGQIMKAIRVNPAQTLRNE